MGLGLSLISKAPSESRKVLSKAFMVSALCFPTWLETAQQREKEKKKKKNLFSQGNTQLSLETVLASTRQSEIVSPFIYPYKLLCESWRRPPCSSPFRKPHPASTLGERQASTDVYSLKFIRHLPAPRLPGSNDRHGH